MDHHRNLLLRSDKSLPESPNLKRFIPQIEKAEFELLNCEVTGEYVGIAFDGTTRLGEAINTTGRWCDSNFDLQMRLLDFHTLKTHVDNVRLATHITEVTRVRNLPIRMLVNIARDSVSVNGAACRRLMQVFTNATDTLCMCRMAVGVWESEGAEEGDGVVEAVGCGYLEGQKGTREEEGDRRSDNRRKVDRGEMDADENGVEGRGRESDAETADWQN
jgi:hypothetical protein